MGKYKVISFLFLFMLTGLLVGAQPRVIHVEANHPGATVQPTMYGVFFEDINMGADGGLYAELIKNRSFEFLKPLMGWTTLGDNYKEGDMLIENRDNHDEANPRYLRIRVHGSGVNAIGLRNEGFRGMGIKEGVGYDFSMLYRQRTGKISLHLQLLDPSGSVLGDTVFSSESTGGQWKKEKTHFHSRGTEAHASFAIWFEGEGQIDVDMISLFPEDTWKNRPGGLRADMVQVLADLKPGFIRFPGGCIVEGYNLSQRYQWKKTIGPVDQRPLVINRWNFEFAHRPTPDYYQTFGLGFFEYFQMAEDIGAEPLPILNCGMACQFNSAEVVPLDELEPYIQDALDLIEFANGSPDTKWGKVRADMGHPEPFHLKMLGVGNENWGPQYLARLRLFTKAIKAKYPDIKLVNSSGTDPAGDRYNYLNDSLRAMHADIIDEHYYRKPDWFFANAGRYDHFPRTGSKVFAGEYAAQSDKTASPHNRNTWLTALSEAAFLTGLERNADVVEMASYAPLFAHVDGWQWTPDLIWVDNLHVYPTPNYYVQQLFSLNKGTRVLPALENDSVLEGKDSLYVSSVLDQPAGELIVKLVNAASAPRELSLNVEGVKKLAPVAVLTVLRNKDLDAMNLPGKSPAVTPVHSSFPVKGKKIGLNLEPYSLAVVRVKITR